MPTSNTPLAFRLRSLAKYQRLPDGKASLVLQFPLRAMIIHDAWQKVLGCLRDGTWMPLEKIGNRVPEIPMDDIERFLNTLVRKGYLVTKGFVRLEAADYPSVSVIIPVRNRPDEITACLGSLTKLDYPDEKLEIIVVDDASEDHTPGAVARFPEVRLIQLQQHRQVSFCRNKGAETARGEILAFIDSDCVAAPTWLKELVPAFRDRSLGAVGGWVDAADDENGLDRYEKVRSALQIGAWFKRSSQSERFFYVPTCNFLVKRDLFLGLDGFRETLHVGEDVDFCWRLQDAGHILEYRPMGKVAHKHRNRILDFCSRRFDYGTSEPVLQKLHTSRLKTFFLPWYGLWFWLGVLGAIILKTGLPLFLCIGLILIDGIKKHGKLKTRQIPITRNQVFIAVIREYFSLAYHCCSFLSRYYLIIVPVVAWLSPLTAAFLFGMHLIAGIVDYMVRKPRLNLLSFLFFFTLEQVSYQSGVWRECIHLANFNPVLPRIIHKLI